MQPSAATKTKNSILHLATYPPRECGIATFTRDLITAFNKKYNPVTKAKVIALNENSSAHYNYPSAVATAINADDLKSYVELAEKINNQRSVKLVNIQHEFGIFGGNWGDYLVPFFQTVKKPVIVTLHSVLPAPDERLKDTVNFIGARARALVVMNARSKKILETDYQIPKSKLSLIPHGIPQTNFEPAKIAKSALGLENKTVLSTFGMLNRDKGIEYVLGALPPLIKKFPELIYLIVGATHPVVLRDEGEEYRNFLLNETERLGLKDHVKFYNRYVTLDEIVKYLKATDIYLSTALNPNQSVSGTLSYALGCGRASISTPSEYAKEIIKEGENGMLVKFNDSKSVTVALAKLLADDKKLMDMHKNAYEETRHMTWPNVAASYAKLYEKFAGISPEERKLPEIKFDHVFRLTDEFGILQHATYDKPHRRWGYSTDDNARALQVAVKHFELTGNESLLPLIETYLDFIKFVSRPDGSFANIVNAGRKRDNTRDSDVFGRSFLALSAAANSEKLPKKLHVKSSVLLAQALKNVKKLTSPRSVAFAIAGLYVGFQKSRSPAAMSLIQKLADRQIKLYRDNSSTNWQWFEDQLTYSNSRLPESLFLTYLATRNHKYLRVAQKTLKFLESITFEPKHYSPIGESGWYAKNKYRAYFDQQPEDAAAMAETKLIAFKTTGEEKHLQDALEAFSWFLGKNHLGLMVYNEHTGGCYDGVGKTGLNINQGAESTLAYLMARLTFEDPEIKSKLRS